MLINNYYFDRFNEWFFAGGARRIGNLFSNVGDGWIIEGVVNGSARMVDWWGRVLRQMQSGYVYHYAFTMIIGLFALADVVGDPAMSTQGRLKCELGPKREARRVVQ